MNNKIEQINSITVISAVYFFFVYYNLFDWKVSYKSEKSLTPTFILHCDNYLFLEQ